MPQPSATTRRKQVRTSHVVADTAVVHSVAHHRQLLKDMDAFKERTVAAPGAAREFLIKAGLVTKQGNPRQLIRG